MIHKFLISSFFILRTKPLEKYCRRSRSRDVTGETEAEMLQAKPKQRYYRRSRLSEDILVSRMPSYAINCKIILYFTFPLIRKNIRIR